MLLNDITIHYNQLILPGREKIKPRGYKAFFMLNSAEHEI